MKKCISLILVFSMIITTFMCMPFTVYAEETNVAQNSNVSVTSATNPGDSSLKKINDNNVGNNNILLLYANKSEDGKNVQVTMDLGNSYDVSKVVVKGRSGSKVYLESVQLYGSNDPKSATEAWQSAELTKLYDFTETLEKNEDKEVILSTAQPFRYIVLWNGGVSTRNLAFGDLEVYSGGINEKMDFYVGLDDVETDEFADYVQGGIDGEYITEVLTGYDFEKLAPYFVQTMDAVSDGLISGSFIDEESDFISVLKISDFLSELNSEATDISGFSDDDLETFQTALGISGDLKEIAELYQYDVSVDIEIMLDKMNFYNDILAAEFETEATTNEKVVVSIENSEDFLSNGTHSVDFVLKSVDSDSVEEEVYSRTESTFEASPVVFEYTYGDDDNEEDYKAYMTISLTGKNADYKKEWSFKHVSPTKAAELYSNLQNADTMEKLETAVEKCLEFDLIKEEDSDVLLAIVDDGLTYYTLAVEALNNGTFNDTEVELINTPVLFKECVNLTVFLNMLANEDMDSFDAAYENVKSLLEDFMSDDFDSEKFKSTYRDNEKTTITGIASNIRFYDALSQFMDATYSQAENVLKKYDDRLGIDVKTDITDKGYAVIDVAKQIDTSIPENYHTDFAGAIAGILSDLPEPEEEDEEEEEEETKKHSGGGGGGGVSIIAPVTPVPEPSVEVKEEIKTSSFTDLDGYDWASEAIENLYGKNIINGTGNGQFNPAASVSREEIIKMIIVAFDYPTVNETVYNFEDTDPDDWHHSYIQSAYQNGIANGMDDVSFGVGRSITRQDLAVMCYRAVTQKAIKLEAKSSDTVFKDATQFADYSWSAINIMSQNGILTGFDDGTFKPNNTATRAEAAVIINRLLTLKGE